MHTALVVCMQHLLPGNYLEPSEHTERILSLAGHRCAEEATSDVIVHQADGLHVGIHDRAADKPKSSLFEVF